MLKRLFVTKVFEGGVNLLTGEHISNGIVISNGQSEVFIPVSSEDVDRLATIVCEDVEKSCDKSSTTEVPNVRVITEGQETETEKTRARPTSNLSLVPSGPGSSYDDELTGVSSL
jgi:hypothetical protein